jgi:hypothetical protein
MILLQKTTLVRIPVVIKRIAAQKKHLRILHSRKNSKEGWLMLFLIFSLISANGF